MTEITDLTAPADTACLASASGIDASSPHSFIIVSLRLSPAVMPPAACKNIDFFDSKRGKSLI